MHTVFALLCSVVVIHWLIFPYPSGLLHWHCVNLTIAPVPAKQPWWIWINTSCEFIMNDCITTTKQSTTKPCAYFLGYTVWPISRWLQPQLCLGAGISSVAPVLVSRDSDLCHVQLHPTWFDSTSECRSGPMVSYLHSGHLPVGLYYGRGTLVRLLMVWCWHVDALLLNTFLYPGNAMNRSIVNRNPMIYPLSYHQFYLLYGC